MSGFCQLFQFSHYGPFVQLLRGPITYRVRNKRSGLIYVEVKLTKAKNHIVTGGYNKVEMLERLSNHDWHRVVLE